MKVETQLTITFIVSLVSTITSYVSMELMLKYMPYASFFNPVVFTGISKSDGMILLLTFCLSLVFAVGSWIDFKKLIEKINSET